MNNIVSWQGSSGIDYQFEVLKPGFEPAEQPGIYIMTAATPQGYKPIYIGEAIDMKRRLGNHEKLNSALKLGANEIHLRLAPRDNAARKSIESDLITKWVPPLNTKM